MLVFYGVTYLGSAERGKKDLDGKQVLPSLRGLVNVESRCILHTRMRKRRPGWTQEMFNFFLVLPSNTNFISSCLKLLDLFHWVSPSVKKSGGNGYPCLTSSLVSSCLLVFLSGVILAFLKKAS